MTPYSAVEPSGGMNTKLQIMLSLDLDKQVTKIPFGILLQL